MTSPPKPDAPAAAIGAPAGSAEPSRRDQHHLGPLRRSVREVGLGLITLGVIVLLFVGYQLVGTNFTEEHNQKALSRQFHSLSHISRSPATTVPATGPPATGPTTSTPALSLPSIPAGGAIDHLVIPKIGVDKFAVEGTDEADLRRGPGHYAGTPYPGQLGNAAFAGHRTTYGAPFYRLNELAAGDPIYVTDLDGRTWLYKVSQRPQVVSPSDVSVLDPTSFAQLTLTTCNPRFSASSRLVVFARLDGRALPATTPVATPAQGSTAKPAQVTSPVLPGADNLGQGTSSAWPATLFYGAAVVLLWIGVRLWINRTRRWHRLAAYLVGIAICLVPLWFCFENAVLLLPQSI